MAISSTPFAGDSGDKNRLNRITFLVGSVKTVSHVDHRGSGSKGAYEKTRDDSTDPRNIGPVEFKNYIDEED